ncbi:MAG: hypothetical protein K0R82_1639 [Flavipsychrobacter sp.]|jgi:hypothetical protein|nr:hypothetical protein [Flavipsychrobacter sp.]
MKKNTAIIIAFLAVMLIQSSSIAQPPMKFNYQGIARSSAGGAIANQTLGLRISILDSNSSGPVLYSETHTPITNAFGLYTVAIGDGTIASGDINAIDWSKADKYIKIEMDPAGGTTYTDLGTKQLLSVPFAAYADHAALILPYFDSTSDAGSLFTIQNNDAGAAIEGINNSTTSSAFAVKGVINSTSPGGFSSAVRGINNGTSNLGIGVYGSQAGSGWGMYGTSPDGLGVYGNTTTGIGLVGNSNSGTGLLATSSTGTGLSASSSSGNGLQATSNTGVAASLTITNNASTANVAEISTTGSGRGIDVATTSGAGVFSNSSGANAVWGITGSMSSAGIIGDNFTGEAVVGRSSGALGVGAVVGRSDGAGYGVRGFNTSTGIGVLGQVISAGTGMAGKFENTNAANTADVVQVNTSTNANGINVTTLSGSAKSAVRATTTAANGNAITGISNTGVGAYGVWGQSSGGYAGFFSGNVNVAGTLSKSAGAFKIDHPMDPANKYLIHSFVESPDMMNIYNGNITTDASGDAVVSLPAYFEVENIDFKYQLTVIGQFAQAIVSKEIGGNKFEIKTDKPNVKVSWMVTGVRNDKFAQKNRIVTEVEKAPNEKGFYLNPEVYGLPFERSIPFSRGTASTEAEVKPEPVNEELPSNKRSKE